jgi:hypothetical protein
MKPIWSFCIRAVVFVLSAAGLHAQSVTATLVGTVLDPSGASLPGATVGTPTYGIIQSAGDARIIQWGARLTF